MKAALYARVSTRDHNQNPETQLVQLRDWVERNPDVDEAEEFVDHASGRNLNRPEWKRMMGLVRRGRIKVVVFTHYDRAFRSLLDSEITLQELDLIGVRVMATQFPMFDTSSALGKMMIQIVATFAELERSLTRERIMLGLERARRAGKHIGGVRSVNLTGAEAHAAVIQHGSERRAARQLHVSQRTFRRRLAEYVPVAVNSEG